MAKRKDLSDFDKGHIVMARLGQSISKMASLLWGFPSMKWLVLTENDASKDKPASGSWVPNRGWHGSGFSNLSRPTPTKKNPIPILRKNWGKILSRSNPGRMTLIPSHSRVVCFYFFGGRNLSVTVKIQNRSQRAHLSWIKIQNVVYYIELKAIWAAPESSPQLSSLWYSWGLLSGAASYHCTCCTDGTAAKFLDYYAVMRV